MRDTFLNSLIACLIGNYYLIFVINLWLLIAVFRLQWTNYRLYATRKQYINGAPLREARTDTFSIIMRKKIASQLNRIHGSTNTILRNNAGKIAVPLMRYLINYTKSKLLIWH